MARFHPQCDELPPRVQPSVTATFSPTAGILSVFGDTASNDILVSDDGVNVIVTDHNNAVNVTGGTPTLANVTQVRVFGADGADVIAIDPAFVVGAGSQNYKVSIDGGSGSDTIIGSSQRDNILGQNGDDSIIGGDGNDNISAGAGNDTVDAGDGNDIVSGQAGDDLLFGGLGNDSMLGQEHDDTLDGGMGNDSLIGSTGDDSIIGGAGSDTITGNSGADTLFAADGAADRVYGDSLDAFFFDLDLDTVYGA